MGAERVERPPVRIAHVGLGAFHRAHQACYTQHAPDAAEWGIAGFTGRSPEAARVLSAQGCEYALIERGPAADRAERIGAVVEAHDGADAVAWLGTLADPAVAVVTVTVSEAGYDAHASPPARIAAGLDARRRADAGPLAVVSCDNLMGNGAQLRSAVRAHADTALAAWIDESVSFVDTMVDRITPATTPADIAAARALTGIPDAAPVVAEPFSEWVLAGAFPAGRPAWDAAGARFVDDIVPYEERKLWLLNAGHSLLAYAGRLRGLTTIDEAFADAGLRALLEQLWAEQRVVVDLPAAEIDDALDALRDRFANARIRHALEQVGRDGALKLPPRIIEPLHRRLDRGLGAGDAQRAVIDAWLACLDRFGAEDAASAALRADPRLADIRSRVDAAVDILSRQGATA